MAGLLHQEPKLDELVCPMCCDTLTEPVMLDCRHSFCKKCINCYWSISRRKSSCPSCQKTIADRAVRSARVLKKVMRMIKTYKTPDYLHRLEKELKGHLQKKMQEAEILTRTQTETQKKLKTVKETSHEMRLKVAEEFRALQEVLQKEEKLLLTSVDKAEEKALARVHDVLLTLDKQFVAVAGQITFLQKILAHSSKYSQIEVENLKQSARSKNV